MDPYRSQDRTPLTFALLRLCQNVQLDDAVKIIRDAVESDKIPGAIVVVARNGKILVEEVYGTSDLENKDTICWLASVTRPITAAAFMTLVGEGKVAIDDPIEKHLPEFKGTQDKEGNAHVITIKQLLTHTSGLPRDPPEWKSKDPRTLEKVVKTVAARKLIHKPGTQFAYSMA